MAQGKSIQELRIGDVAYITTAITDEMVDNLRKNPHGPFLLGLIS